MRYVADRFVVILDANVLFPFRKRDVLLRFSHAGLFRARWSGEILDEWTRNLLALKPHLEDSIRAQQRAMQDHFPEALVTGHEPLVSALDLPDPDDRHVLAAAIAGSADGILTLNARDFPRGMLAEEGLWRADPDGFVHGIWQAQPDLVAKVAQGVLAKARRLSQGDWEMRPLLKKARLPRLAS